MRLVLPFLLLAWPLAEIAAFILVGKALGLWFTLSLVILTGIMGALLLRQQGIQILRKLSEEGRRGEIPAGSVVEGAMVVVAAILLLLPGFLTDVIGLALFVPAVRRLVWSAIGKKVVVASSSRRAGFRRAAPSASDASMRPPGATAKVLDLDEDEFHRDGSSGPSSRNSSPWSKPGGPDRP
jgi:UPF0716 protein FxsA